MDDKIRKYFELDEGVKVINKKKSELKREIEIYMIQSGRTEIMVDGKKFMIIPSLKRSKN